MLSLANVSAGISASYYERDDYYSKEDTSENNKAYSKWEGTLAKELGLKGEVKLEHFDSMLKGKIIKVKAAGKDTNKIKQIKDIGEEEEKINKINESNKEKQTKGINKEQKEKIVAELGRISGKSEKEHSAGIDLTFSAPKSVSILSEIGGDGRVTIAHREAVTKTLAFLEKEFIRSRVRTGGSNTKDTKVDYKLTSKAAIATYQHNTSRNLDPQLHTHAVIINATKTEDGKYRSAEFYKVFQNKMLLGKVYRNELARNLKEIGYTPEIVNHKDGRFELKEIKEEVRKHFSTRRQEIKEALSSYNYQNAKTAALATLQTREVKKDVNRKELKAEWNKRIEGLQVNLKKIISTAKENSKSLTHNKENKQQIKELTKEAINFGISHLSEKESVFDKNKLIGTALVFSPEVRLSDIIKEIDSKVENKELIQKDEKLIPSNTLILEKENLKLLKVSKDTMEPIIKDFNISSLQSNTLNEGQKGSVSLVLNSKDRIIGIQGSAGTGKTYMLRTASTLLERQGYSIIGMAPSASAALTLKEEAGLPSAITLQKFLKQYEGLYKNRETESGLNQIKTEFNKKIIVVDEASMISSKQMNSLLKITEKLDIKVVLTGDIKQLASVEAGKPFYQMQEAGMKTAKMTEIIRQKDILLKQAVEAVIKGNIEKAFERIGDNIIEKGKDEKVANLAVREYFKLSKEERNKTLVLSPENSVRSEINNLIREGLKGRGEFSANKEHSINHVTLESRNLSAAEKQESFNYRTGEVIIFNKNYKAHSILQGETFNIVEVKQNSLILEREGGINNIEDKNQKIEFSLKQKSPDLEVFKKTEKELSIGEQIRYTRNDKQKNIINSHIAIITNINKKSGEITLKEETHKKIKTQTVKITESFLKHIDYAYASTAFSSQGKTTERVIAVLESNKPLTNQQTFYVEISRAKNEVILIVDKREDVRKTLERNRGVRVSALEAVRVNERVRNYSGDR